MGNQNIILSRCKTFLRLGRVSNLPTVWSNVLAGMGLAGEIRPDTLPWLLPSVTLCYLGGMFLNDAFDQRIDAAERPERPIPSGQISANTVSMLGFAMLTTSLILLYPLGSDSLAVGFTLCILIVVYDLYHKQNPLSPLIMGLCRATVYWLACASLAAPFPWLGAGLITAYIAGLTYTAKQENQPVIRRLGPLGLFTIPPLWAAGSVTHDSLPYLLAFLGWTVYALRMALLPPRRIRQGVGALIAGVSLFDAVLLATSGHADISPYAFAAFLLTLLLHRRIAGT